MPCLFIPSRTPSPPPPQPPGPYSAQTVVYDSGVIGNAISYLSAHAHSYLRHDILIFPPISGIFFAYELYQTFRKAYSLHLYIIGILWAGHVYNDGNRLDIPLAFLHNFRRLRVL